MLTLFQDDTRNPVREILDNADYGMVVIGAMVVAAILSRVSRLVITALLRWVSRRSLRGADSFWIVRLPRALSESDELAELRRSQRIQAGGIMLSRFATVAIWLTTFVVVLALLDVDVVWAVSSAGFLGAAVAIGGQHSVHDYLNGVHILIEDRFGEGDLIEITHPSGEVRSGLVQRVGAFSTHIVGDRGTWHLANRTLAEVINLSQNTTHLSIAVPSAEATTDETLEPVIQAALRQLTGRDHALIIDDVAPTAPGETVHITARTTAHLTTAQHDDLARDLAARLGQQPDR